MEDDLKFFSALNLFQMEDNLNILVNGTRPQKMMQSELNQN
jgi:hypothetical protein